MSDNSRRGLTWYGVLVGLLVLSLGLVLAAPYIGNLIPKNTKVITELAPKETTEPEACTTWESAVLDHTNNQALAGGLPDVNKAIASGKTVEGIKQTVVLIHTIKLEASSLAGYSAHIFKSRPKVDPSTLFDENGCATPAAVKLVEELETELLKGYRGFENAPSDGYNSGHNGQEAVQSDRPGISGDLRAMKFVLSDGRTIWIMTRCGNIVENGKNPNLSVGATDNDVPDQLKDGGQKHKADPKDRQDDPKGDAKKAKKKAEKKNQEDEEEHVEVVGGSTGTGSGSSNGSSGGQPNW